MTVSPTARLVSNLIVESLDLYPTLAGPCPHLGPPPPPPPSVHRLSSRASVLCPLSSGLRTEASVHWLSSRQQPAAAPLTLTPAPHTHTG